MTFLVSGSIAYDNIMTFGGKFKEHILPDKMHVLNVSFLVDSMHKNFGGTGGNIAYNLRLLDQPVSLFGTVGKDFDSYREHCLSQGIDLSGVREFADLHTASCFITTDRDNNQITGFYPGAMTKSAATQIAMLSNLSEIDFAIIAPDDPKAMLEHAEQCRLARIPFVMDIGQQVIAFGGEDLLAAIAGATTLIGNDYEIETFQRKTGKTLKQLLAELDYLIVTKGGSGSVIHTAAASFDIPAAEPTQVVDPTGAGDAYRAGILTGLKLQLPLAQTGRIASLIACYAVEEYGTQNHHFSHHDFCTRYQQNFDQVCPILLN